MGQSNPGPWGTTMADPGEFRDNAARCIEMANGASD